MESLNQNIGRPLPRNSEGVSTLAKFFQRLARPHSASDGGQVLSKPIVRGKSVFLREVTRRDIEFIHGLRLDPKKSAHLSRVDEDIERQIAFIEEYQKSEDDFYFIICDWAKNPLGTIRIYDTEHDSFTWGSWIISDGAPPSVSIESIMMLYDFGFFSLHFRQAFFDVRRRNQSVIRFHHFFGARELWSDHENTYFSLSLSEYLLSRDRFRSFLP